MFLAAPHLVHECTKTIRGSRFERFIPRTTASSSKSESSLKWIWRNGQLFSGLQRSLLRPFRSSPGKLLWRLLSTNESLRSALTIQLLLERNTSSLWLSPVLRRKNCLIWTSDIFQEFIRIFHASSMKTLVQQQQPRNQRQHLHLDRLLEPRRNPQPQKLRVEMIKISASERIQDSMPTANATSTTNAGRREPRSTLVLHPDSGTDISARNRQLSILLNVKCEADFSSVKTHTRNIYEFLLYFVSQQFTNKNLDWKS